MSDNKKANSSIVYKLNTWHLSQVFLSFFWIDIIFVSIFVFVLGYHAESYMADTVKTPIVQNYIIEESPNGIKLPKIIDAIFPESMEGAIRQVLQKPEANTFWEKLYVKKYRVWVPLPDENSYFAIDYDIADNIAIFITTLFSLFIFQLLFLIGSIGKGARAMRLSLKPIADLTQTARKINTTQAIPPNLQLRNLTGTIDMINVKQLDTRISISSDENELKDLAFAINGMLDRINESYRSQVRFVSDASHELRTPIAVIQGYANLLDRWGKNDEKALQESIEAIKSESESMKGLVEQLLFLARGDTDSMYFSMEDINLSELVDEIMCETIMIDPNHEFHPQINADVYTIGDPQLIKQAIRIFIDNSVKYTPYEGSITVTTISEGDYAKILIQDDGIGIPHEDIPYVFDRFFRSDESRARKSGGTGLGLSIAKWIIDRHNGSVEILSRLGLGTRVTVCLICKKSDNIEVDL